VLEQRGWVLERFYPHLSDSTFICFRTALNPNAFASFRSEESASSVGAVYNPSGQYP
jgi:hypothetical protein